MNKVEKNLSTKKNNKNVIELSAGGRDDDDDDEGKTVFFSLVSKIKDLYDTNTRT